MLSPKTTTWILVCDGARARILSRHGPGGDLMAIDSSEHPSAREKGTELASDRPGRTFDSFGQGRHAKAPPTDWQQYEKTRFAREMAEQINAAARNGRFDQLMVIAPPRVLGDLRSLLDAHARKRISAEVGKDLTNLSEAALADAVGELLRPGA